jgi:Predicted hydrolase (HAD superfamily)
LTVPKFDAKFSIYGSFDLFVSSALEGVKKPDARIFLPTAQKLGVVPEECLFMDDTKINIKGAAAVGMETIWWENKETGFEKFLETIGVDKLL